MAIISGYALELTFDEPSDVLLSDVSALLYDLELSHDFGLLLTVPTYESYTFDRYFWYRNGRPLQVEDRVRAGRISHESPLFVEIILPTIAGLWGLIQIIQKVDTWKLEKEKLELEVRQLRRQEQRNMDAIREDYAAQFDQRLETEEKRDILRALVNRLNESQLKLHKAKLRAARQDEVGSDGPSAEA